MGRKINIEKAEQKLKSLLDDDIIMLGDAYRDNGFDFFMVGGSVRDALLEREPKDLDFCTNATPEETLKILSTLPNIKLNLQGEHFAVVVAYTPLHPEGIEIAAFRSDGIGRKPEVTTGVSYEEDVQRRDFTINALYFDIAEIKIIDTVYGVADLFHGVIRTVGNPIDRFREDALRKLRCFRFASRFDFGIETNTWEALMNDPSLEISKDRIWNELKVMYKGADDKFQLLQNLSSSGLLRNIFDGIKIGDSFLNSYNTNIETFNLFLAEILTFADTDLKRLVEHHRFEVNTVKSIETLKKLENNTYSATEITKFWQARKSCDLTDDEILIYMLNSVETQCLLEVKFDTELSLKLMEQGLQGADLGKAINKHYFEQYKNKLSLKQSGNIRTQP